MPSNRGRSACSVPNRRAATGFPEPRATRRHIAGSEPSVPPSEIAESKIRLSIHALIYSITIFNRIPSYASSNTNPADHPSLRFPWSS